MSRNIVLLSDGTGNSAAKVWRTNVWRTFEALDLSGNDQVAFYDDGVGTSSFKPWAILGGAFGFGLKRNVIDIYKFACRNYRDEDDHIYGFGFQPRRLHYPRRDGPDSQSGPGLRPKRSRARQKALAAYREYRRERYHTIWHLEDPFRRSANVLSAITTRRQSPGRRSASSASGTLWPPMARRWTK